MMEDCLLSDIMSSQRVCKLAYEKLRQQVRPTSQNYWDAKVDGGIFNSIEVITNWKDIYSLAFVCSIDSYTRYFQFRFIHNIMPTNKFLFRIGIMILTFAPSVIILKKLSNISCGNVTMCITWNQITTWMNEEQNIFFSLDYKTICFWFAW